MRYTLARIATELLNHPSLSPLTKKSYETVLMRLAEQYGSLAIEDVKRSHIELYFQSLTGISFRTHNRYQAIVQRLFSYAAEQGYITSNPVVHIRPRKPDATQSEHKSDEIVRYLKKHELEALFTRTKRNVRLHALVVLLYETGARVSEILALNVSQIDFNEFEFQVLGKGNKKRWCYFGPHALTALKNSIGRREGSHHEALFTERHKINKQVRRLTYATAYAEWKEILSDHATLKTAGFHHLRHTFATERAQVVPLEVLRALLGHENIQTTLIYQKITSQVAKEQAHNALEKINKSI
jgi:integrase/recombinase XerD